MGICAMAPGIPSTSPALLSDLEQNYLSFPGFNFICKFMRLTLCITLGMLLAVSDASTSTSKIKC